MVRERRIRNVLDAGSFFFFQIQISVVRLGGGPSSQRFTVKGGA